MAWFAALFFLVPFLCRGESQTPIEDSRTPPEERKGAAPPNPSDGPGDGKTMPPVSGAGDSLEFLNGDTLHGVLQSIDPQSGVRWEVADPGKAIEFVATNISKIRLNTSRSPGSQLRHGWVIRLTNQDELPGNLLSLDAQKLVLDTWYAGKLAIQRKGVQSMVPARVGPSVIYEGPTGLEGWTAQKGDSPWKYRNGAFFTQGTGTLGLARDLKLPEQANVQFDIAWRGSLSLAVNLYTDQLKNTENADCFMFSFSDQNVSLYRMKPDGDSVDIGEAQIPELAQKDKARIGIRINKERRILEVLVNGVLIRQWKDPEPFPGKGTGVMFCSQGGGLLALRNIRVSQWNGELEVAPPSTEIAKEDVLYLANHDRVSGKLQSLLTDKMVVATTHGTLNISMQNVARVEMAAEKPSPSDAHGGKVRAFFVGNGCLTFQLEKWDRRQTVGSSPHIGKIKFAPGSFQLIQFNLDRQKSGVDEMGSDVDESRYPPCPMLEMEKRNNPQMNEIVK